ncbi:protein big brother-like [Arctopsyche grandis]|uniref:protein big brother-like n=1 Tax=Arctopsyche grandis TaxID=121162 RepID=UPI00406D8418
MKLRPIFHIDQSEARKPHPYEQWAGAQSLPNRSSSRASFGVGRVSHLAKFREIANALLRVKLFSGKLCWNFQDDRMHSMSDAAALAGMLPFDSMGLYEQPKPRFIFKMPRVVPDQKAKFESDDLFKRLSRESEVRYTGYRDRPLEERQVRFQNGCREGHAEVAFTATGTNLQLVFSHAPYTDRECDFQKERGKVHLVSRFIMNGVCVIWRGSLDLERLDGAGGLELDTERAAHEDALLRDQIERYNQRLRDFEEKQRAYRDHAHQDMELRMAGGLHQPRCHQQSPRHPQHGSGLKPHSQGPILS